MNTSHTEDHSIPPKGVEVIGDLPAGTPWWDAEELGIRTLPVKWYVWLGLPILVLVALEIALIGLRILSSAAAVILIANSSGDFSGGLIAVIVFMAGLVFASLLAISLPVSAIGLALAIMFRKYDLILRDLLAEWTPTQTYWDHFKTRSRRRDLRFDLRTANVRPFNWAEQTFERGNMANRVYLQKMDDEDTGLEIDAAYMGDCETDPGYLTISTERNVDGLCTLLNYRIAKAKGENPTPPEFL